MGKYFEVLGYKCLSILNDFTSPASNLHMAPAFIELSVVFSISLGFAIYLCLPFCEGLVQTTPFFTKSFAVTFLQGVTTREQTPGIHPVDRQLLALPPRNSPALIKGLIGIAGKVPFDSHNLSDHVFTKSLPSHHHLGEYFGTFSKHL